MSKDIREFTVLRPTWLRGEDSFQSYLKREYDGKLCIMGQYLKACGVPEDWMVQQRSINDMLLELLDAEWKDLIPDWVLDQDFESIASRIVGLNDNTEISNTKMEHAIIQLFLMRGVTVRFKDSEVLDNNETKERHEQGQQEGAEPDSV